MFLLIGIKFNFFNFIRFDQNLWKVSNQNKVFVVSCENEKISNFFIKLINSSIIRL